MSILLLGARGQLGRSFIEDGRLAAQGPLIAASRDGHGPDGLPLEAIDLTRPDQLTAALDRLQPQVIVNAAAYTAVDRAEQDEALAWRINAEAVGVLGQWARRYDALLVHYSTDYVFDGADQAPRRPGAPTAPLNVYGRSKRGGELALLEGDAPAMILRTSWVYAAHGKNFLTTVLRLARERDALAVVADQHGAPTSTDILVEGTLHALRAWREAAPDVRSGMTGIHHLTASGHTSWHGFAVAALEMAHARGLLDVVPPVRAISTAEFGAPAARPTWSLLDTRGMHARFGYRPPHWRDALATVLDRLATGP